MSTSVEICKLCGRTDKLSRSHIVPELAYDPIKNDKNQMYVMGEKTKTVQSGYWEYLLCSTCENLLSGYETKFKQDWMNSVPRDFNQLATKPLDDVISVDVPDYDAFKLFHLSVFWRAAVSNGFKIGTITFGPYESEIAALVRGQKSGTPGDFPFFAVLNLDKDRRPVPTVTQLAQGRGRFEGSHHYYMMSYAFCDWTMIVSRPGPDWMAELETKAREERKFLLFTVPHSQSKSFTLSAEIIQRFRQVKK